MNTSENNRPNEDESPEDKKRPEGGIESFDVVQDISDEMRKSLGGPLYATQSDIEGAVYEDDTEEGNSDGSDTSDTSNNKEVNSEDDGGLIELKPLEEDGLDYSGVTLVDTSEVNPEELEEAPPEESPPEEAPPETAPPPETPTETSPPPAPETPPPEETTPAEAPTETAPPPTPEAPPPPEEYIPAPVANTGIWAKAKSFASNAFSVPREVATYPVAKHVVDGGGIAASTGLGAAAGISVLPSAIVRAVHAGGGLGQSIVSSSIIPTAIPVARHITGGVGAWRANRHFHAVVDDNLLEAEIAEQLKKAHTAMEPKYTKQHMLLAQALAKVGPTPAETAKLVWEKNHSKECATNLIRIIDIVNAKEGDLLHVPGLTAKEVQEWQKRIGDLELEELQALRDCDIYKDNMQKILAEVATHNGKIVEEVHRKQHDKRMTPLVAASGVAGAATLTLAGVPLLMAGVPAVTSGIYMGSKYFYNRLNKRKNTILPHRKGITMASGAPLPPEETYDYKGTLYRKRVIEKTSADAAGNSKNVKEFADAIRNAFPPDLDDFAFFDTKHDLAKALAPYAVQALKEVDEPAEDRDDGKVAELEGEVQTLQGAHDSKRDILRDMQQQLNKSEHELSNLKSKNMPAAEKAETYFKNGKKENLNSFDYTTQTLIEKENEFNKLKAHVIKQLKKITKAAKKLERKRKELNAEKFPKTPGKFTPEKAISNEDAQKALAVVVDEKWKEWTEQTGIAGSFLRSLGIKVSQNQVMKEMGKATASAAASGAGLYALAASYGLPPGLGALVGVYIGWKIYTSVLKTNS